MEFNEEHKKRIEDAITETMVSSIESEKLYEEDLPFISSFVLDRIDKINTQDELILFLTELSQKWNIFSSIMTSEQNMINKKEVTQAANEAQDLIKSGQIEEALKVTKEATQ